MFRSLVRKISGDKPGKTQPVTTDAIMAEVESDKVQLPRAVPDPVLGSSDSVKTAGKTAPAKELVTGNGDQKLTNDEIFEESEQKQKTAAAVSACGMCENSISSCKPKGSINCGVCETIYCLGCADFTAHANNTVLNRTDVFWACYQCLPEMTNKLTAKPCEHDEPQGTNEPENAFMTSMQNEIVKMSSEMKALGEGIKACKRENFESLKSLLESSLQSVNSNVIPVTDPIVSEIVAGVSAAWHNTHMSADYRNSDSDSESEEEDFPDAMTKVMSKKEKRELSRAQREEKNSIKLVQAALASQKDDEERQKNLIIYRLPETLTSISEARTKDQESIKTLLETLDVDSAPVEIRRLGRFDKDIVKDRPRPVKVVLLDRNERDLAMANVSKLAKVTDPIIKSVQVNYDLNRNQREKQKELVAEGKDLTKNSTTHIWKVRGPPENMQLRKFLRRAQAATNLSVVP